MASRRPGPLSDILVGVGAIAIAGTAIWDARSLPPAFYDPLGASGVVTAAAVMVLVFAVLVILQGVRSAPSQAGEAARERTPLWPPLASILCVGAYLLAMQAGLLRFQEATVLFFIAYSLLHKWPTPRELLLVAILALLLGYGGHYLFSNVFLVNLPV